MKSSLVIAAALAALALCPVLRAQNEKPEAPKPSLTEENRETKETAKKEKPRRPEVGETPAPRPRLEGKSGPKSVENRDRVAKRTWIGISTQYVDPSLRDHLEIPEGFGIQVVDVMPDSPAAQAGLRSNDIVLRFEDQRLISPEHLSVLVRSKASGDKTELTLIRKGKEETVSVTLGEADENAFGPFGDASRGLPEFPMSPHFGRNPSQWQEQIRKQQDEILRQQKEWMEKNHQEWRGHDPSHPAPQQPPGARPEKGEVKPGGRPPGVSVSPGFPLRVFGTEGVLNIDNEQGELTLTRKDDAHQLTIKDADGKVVYDGPFDPQKGVEGLPEEARKQLETMKLGNLEIRLPDMPAEQPEKTGEAKEAPAKDSGGIL